LVNRLARFTQFPMDLLPATSPHHSAGAFPSFFAVFPAPLPWVAVVCFDQFSPWYSLSTFFLPPPPPSSRSKRLFLPPSFFFSEADKLFFWHDFKSYFSLVVFFLFFFFVWSLPLSSVPSFPLSSLLTLIVPFAARSFFFPLALM